MLYLLLMPVSPAMSQWISLSKSLQELNIHEIASDPKNPSIIISASERQVYKSKDAGATWIKVMALRGSNRVTDIHFDTAKPGRVYLSTQKGIYRSENFGDRWEVFFKGIGENKSQFNTVAAFSGLILAGAADGLFVMAEDGREAQRVEELPRATVYALSSTGPFIFAVTEKGIYRSQEGRRWHSIYSEVRNEVPTSLERFNIEEISLLPPPGLAYAIGTKRLFYGAREGMIESQGDGQQWDALRGQPFKKIHCMTAGATTVFTATDTGIYRWDPSKKRFEELYLGLDSKEVRALSYSPVGDYLLAATRTGILKYAHPELGLSPYAIPLEAKPSSADLLLRFENEPTISEVQNAAIRYAEVHPDKIANWRKAASRKAYFPSVSLSRSVKQDENIDIDRGGTGDPDRFIYGPMENSYDWAFNLSWDLGDIVWNDDQTSIDTRSRLLVELRDDILSKVTHLYYERRRLQIDMTLAPKSDLGFEVENTIKLQELTAGIDALTGGYFNQRSRIKLNNNQINIANSAPSYTLEEP